MRDQLPAHLLLPGDMVEDLNGKWHKVTEVATAGVAGRGRAQQQVRIAFETRGDIVGSADAQYPVWRAS